MDLNLDVKSINCYTNSARRISIEIENADESDILNHFRIKEIIEHYGISELLDTIGQDECESYFDLKPNE